MVDLVGATASQLVEEEQTVTQECDAHDPAAAARWMQS